MSLLVWLTGVNIVVYGGLDNEDPVSAQGLVAAEEETANNPAGPDEKAADAPTTLSEEFLHDYQEAFLLMSKSKTLTFLQYQSALCYAHFPVFSPPPNA